MRENCTYGSWRSLSPTVYIIRKGEKFTHETAVDYSEMRAAGGHNIAFVTKDFDADGYMKNLRSNIKVGTPIWVKIDEINIIDGRNPEENPYFWMLDIPMVFKLI